MLVAELQHVSGIPQPMHGAVRAAPSVQAIALAGSENISGHLARNSPGRRSCFVSAAEFAAPGIPGVHLHSKGDV